MSSATPLVSVIIPAFNAQSTLRETLKSAGGQSWQHLEIIIVDDGSTDRTEQIASDFCARDERARLISQPNGGESAARNRAISEARGEWIAPLDADDLWHPEKLESQLLVAQSDPSAGLIYCWSRLIDGDGRVIGNAPASRCEGDVLTEHLRSNFVGNGSTPMVRAEVLGSVRYDANFEACADYLMQLQLAMSTRFAVARAYLTGYRISARSVSSDAVRMISGHIQLFDKLMSSLPEAERRIAVKERARWLARYGLVQSRRGRLREGAASLTRAFSSSPLSAGAEVASQFQRAVRRGRISEAKGTGKPFLSLDPERP